ncbi:39S ribosomal protein L45, mitochondrial-like isoform X1 [Patiria miniata]|uniref:Large ribosomal subunit protein mL45 n=1 Tax=Patiria miniata TaxID=46514 RepID=A0A914BPB2_PATMI|nr:39S ribosomal protein L45, mitochondrial-like isoform X1 [Patiria miniata]
MSMSSRTLKFMFALMQVQQVACLSSCWLIPVRHRTRINPPKATKKGRLLLKDQERLKLKEEYKQDPQKMLIETLKKSGIKPCPSFTERAVTITCTGEIFEPYVPPEGDGKAMSLTPEGAKQRLERVKNIGVTQLNQRKIRQFEPEFTASEFAWKAQKIFIDAHNALQDFDKNILHQLATEKAYPEMTKGFRFKTIRWKFLESIEKPRVVHIRTTDMINKGNLYGQVTVRFHSKQTLAIYDRFGRIMLGSEDIPKDVLDYVVFEKHLSGLYGSWRIHGKIIPDWASSLEPVIQTMIMQGQGGETDIAVEDR